MPDLNKGCDSFTTAEYVKNFGIIILPTSDPVRGSEMSQLGEDLVQLYQLTLKTAEFKSIM